MTLASSRECYMNKVEKICFDKYFDRSFIYKVKDNEEYYIDDSGLIYTFDNVIKVRFKSIGAIFTILNHLELEFVDKKKNEIYLFKVKDRQDLFPTISKLNSIKTIMIAEPYKIRKYTNTFIQRQQEAKRARFEAVMKKAELSKSNKNSEQRSTNKNIGFTIPEEEKEKKSFLKGNI